MDSGFEKRPCDCYTTASGNNYREVGGLEEIDGRRRAVGSVEPDLGAAVETGVGEQGGAESGAGRGRSADNEI